VQLAIAFVAGVVFALGLAVSGMTNPGRIVGFLDVAGTWDPSLALVMAGAVSAHLAAAQWALRARKPLWAAAFSPIGSSRIDAPLVAGAAFFGVGWGAAGFCPGPALVDLVAPSTSVVAFVISMIAGMGMFHAARRGWPKVRLARVFHRISTQ